MKKPFKSKKAMFFEISLVIITIAVLSTALFMLSFKKEPFEKGVGERQFGIIDIYQNAEKALFFIDQSAKYSAYQSVYDLGQKGNFQDASKYNNNHT